MSDPVVEKTWKERGIEWIFAQGTTVIVLITILGALAYWNYQYFPARDAAWGKVISDQAESFSKALEDRDKRFIEYRSKADQKYAETVTSLITSHEKDYDRLERLLTGRINDIQRHSESTARKVETLMP